MLHFSLSTAGSVTAQSWFGFLLPNQRIFILYLLTSLVMAWFVWRAEMRREGKKGVRAKEFFAYVFHPGIYGHRSSWQDYFIFYVNGLLHYGLLAQFLLTERPFAALTRDALNAAFGRPEHPLMTGVAAAALATLVLALLYDLAVYCGHSLTHKVPLLWAFHKVHHSAEVLTPVTLLRMHPVDLFLNGLLVVMFTGAGIGLFSYLALREVSEVRVLETNAVLFGFYYLGYNLRHSHVWLHYPPWLARFLVSPAQHQIHHSTHPRHFDKNMGLMFSFWDRLFGTLYDPKEREEIQYGINRKTPNPYASMKALYLQPFAECRDIIRARFAKKGVRAVPGLAATLAGFVGIAVLYLQMATLANGALMEPSSVYLEDLTWTEVEQAQQNGYDAIIIPAGGTEQGGPHVVLGKHNYIVHRTAGEIAKRAGHALVAPVIAYVPEGDIDPELTGNMPWTGTAGVPPQVFGDTLYWAATSFKKHGFKYIFFIGDHGLDQEPQQHVAEKLSALWKKDGVTVASIGDYYGPRNGQAEWLKQKGFSDKAIGWHAGIRDTSELMYVHPKGVRSDPITVLGRADGVHGDPARATAEIGRQMIELKVGAAVEGIRKVRAGESTAPLAPLQGAKEE